MEGLDRKQALRNLAALFGKGSMPAATLDLIVERSGPWSDPAFKRALDSIANDPERKQHFPTWAEILERLPPLPSGGGHAGGDRFSWSASGTWSGDPSKATPQALLLALGVMLGSRLPTEGHRTFAELRQVAVRKGVPDSAIDAAAACFARTGDLDQDWLKAMIEGRAPCEWPRAEVVRA